MLNQYHLADNIVLRQHKQIKQKIHFNLIYLL